MVLFHQSESSGSSKGRGKSVGTHFLELAPNFEMRRIFSFSIGATPKKKGLMCSVFFFFFPVALVLYT